MQVDVKDNFRRLLIWVGFGIGASVFLLAYIGIAGLLFFISWFRLPEEELAIFTSIFYGIVFLIALGGVRYESRRTKMLITRRPFETEASLLSGQRKVFSRIKTALWYVFGSFSLVWLTPALVIYWADPRSPDMSVSLFAYLFSLIAVTVYALKRGKRIRTVTNHLILYFSAVLGALIMGRLVAVLYP